MFEIMMNCIEMAKEEVVWILVFMQTGMILFAMTAMATIKLTRKYVFKED